MRWVLLLLVVLSGCRTTSESHAFPQAWPSGLTLPSPKNTVASKISSEIWVEPMAGDALSTGHQLTQGLVEYLRANGIPARLKEGQECQGYLLTAQPNELGYVTYSGYPRKIIYKASFHCKLVDAATGRVIFDRDVSHEFEHHVLVNTMTRMPQDPYSHEQMLLRHAVIPVWEALASSIRVHLTS